MDTQKQKRSAFSGKIGFVLSAAGASVGLGASVRCAIAAKAKKAQQEKISIVFLILL